MNGMGRLSSLSVLALAPLVASLSPSPSDIPAALTAGSPDPFAPLLASVALAAWTCTAWLVLLAALAWADRLPGVAGRAASRLSALIAPAAICAVVRTALGMSLAGSVLCGSTALAADRTASPLRGATTASSTSPAATTPATPTADGESTAPPAAEDDGAATASSLDWPTLGRVRSQPPRTSQPPQTSQPASASAAASPVAPSLATPHRAIGPGDRPLPTTRSHLVGVPETRPLVVPPGEPVVVRAGDSLWSIAARALPKSSADRQIAQAWPRWWSANRAVIGDDPDLIHPGAQLSAPGPNRPAR